MHIDITLISILYYKSIPWHWQYWKSSLFKSSYFNKLNILGDDFFCFILNVGEEWTNYVVAKYMSRCSEGPNHWFIIFQKFNKGISNFNLPTCEFFKCNRIEWQGVDISFSLVKFHFGESWYEIVYARENILMKILLFTSF